MDVLDQGVTPESPTGTVEPSTPAVTPPGAEAGQPAAPEKLTPFHQHPDWQRMVRERNDARTQLQQFQQELQALKAQQPQPTGPSQDEMAAAEALLKLMDMHPELKMIRALAKSAPQIVQGYQGVQQLTKAQQENLYRAGRNEIESLAKAADLPTSGDSVDHLEEMVTGVIRRDDGLTERFQQGDISAVREAFNKVANGFVANLRRAPVAALADTKDKTKKLPPAPRGSAAGPEAPAKPEPGKEREYASSLHKRAMEMLKG